MIINGNIAAWTNDNTLRIPALAVTTEEARWLEQTGWGYIANDCEQDSYWELCDQDEIAFF